MIKSFLYDEFHEVLRFFGAPGLQVVSVQVKMEKIIFFFKVTGQLIKQNMHLF